MAEAKANPKRVPEVGPVARGVDSEERSEVRRVLGKGPRASVSRRERLLRGFTTASQPRCVFSARALSGLGSLSGLSSLSGLGRAIFGVVWTAGATSGALLGQVVTRDKELFCRATRLWGRVLARRWGMQLRTYGMHRVPSSETYVFMGNHQSYADIVAIFAALPVYPHFIAKKELGRVPFLGQALRAGQHILVDRKGGRSASASLNEAAAKIAAGRSVVIFPEGTRSADGKVGAFRSGGFHLAKRAKVAIVPFALRGTADVLARDGFSVRPGEVDLVFGTPIPADEVASTSARELMERVHSEVCELVDSRTFGEEGA